MKIVLLLTLLLAPAFGAEEGEHKSGHNEPSIAWKWANFFILAGVLGVLVKKNAGPYFASRNTEIQSGLRDAAKVREEAEARIANIEKKVANLDAETKLMREQARQEMNAEGERIKEATAKAIAKNQAQAQVEIASATKLAKQQLKTLSADLAIQLATAQIRDRITPSTQERLAKDFVTALGSRN